MKTITYTEWLNLTNKEKNIFTGIVSIPNYYIIFYKNGKKHREDGPAKTCGSKSEEWYFEGKLHRKDGPAIIYSDGSVDYWVNGIKLENCNSDKALQLYVDLLKLKRLSL
jgi:hypothetical protein